MKAYLAVTTTLFGLLAAVHIWRVVAERSSLATEPAFVALTLASAALCVWGVRLFVRMGRR